MNYCISFELFDTKQPIFLNPSRKRVILFAEHKRNTYLSNKSLINLQNKAILYSEQNKDPQYPFGTNALPLKTSFFR